MSEAIVLLVEDEPLIALLAKDALETAGYAVIAATTGPEAIRILAERAHELSGLATDIRLPRGPDGWEIGRRARELRSNLPVVYTTGDSAVDWSARGVPESVVVQKPYATAQLLTVLSTLIRAADANRGG